MPISLTKESDVDVLLIGAGPAGLMCAHALASAGVSVRIIDQRPAKVAAGQADGIQPRTIEVLQSYGLADRLLREGCQLHMAAFYNPSPDGDGIERVGRAADVNAASARYPFEVTLHQGAIEAIFLDAMHDQGLNVDRPVVPVSLELSEVDDALNDPHAHPVKVVLEHVDSGDTEVVHAKFVVGADGAHSWVRKTLGIAMEGEQTDYIWGVLDIIPETDFPDIRNRCAIHSTNGSCMIIPREGDAVRLYLQLTAADAAAVIDPATGRVDRTRSGPRELLDVARRSFAPYSIEARPEAVQWWTLYVIGQRVASSFSVRERVFIVGDACHTHSPKAGQGMNASMNDSHNLAWKIAHVLRGWADMSLLKTYEHERRQYAQDLIAFDKQFAKLFSGKPRTHENQDGVSHEEFLQAFKTHGLFTSGIGIHYRPSAIVHPTTTTSATTPSSSPTPARALIPGQRMPPHIFVRAADARPVELQDLLPADTRFKLLVFAGAIAEPAQRARVLALANAMAEPGGLFARLARAAPDKVRTGTGMAPVLDVIAIAAGRKELVDYTDLPVLFRPHWSKVLVDDMDMHGRSGGGGYDAYGVDVHGALVVVRPDGFVGVVAPFEHLNVLDKYFASFMLPA